MKPAAWIAAAALSLGLAAPVPAHASSCSGGGGSSDSGSSDSGSSDSGSSDSGSSGDSSSSSGDSGSTGCHDADEPVGLRDCTRFGKWGAALRIPRFIVAFGTVMRRSPSLGLGASGHVAHENEGFSYRTVEGSPGASSDTSILGTMRLGMGLWKPVYAAVDVELGGLTSGPARAEMTSSGMRGTPTITNSSTLALNALGVVGARTGNRHGSLGLEVAGGVRVINHSFHSQYLSCEQYTSIQSAAPILELRATAQRWLNPWVNIGATLGGSVIDRGAWVTGIHLGFETQAFGGER